MLSIMLFIFFCFLGIAALCWHILRTQEKHFLQLRQEQARLAALLTAQHAGHCDSQAGQLEDRLVLPTTDTAALAPSETAPPAAPLQAAGCANAIPENGPDRLSLDTPASGRLGPGDAPPSAIPAGSLPTAAPALELRFDTLPPLRDSDKART